MFERFSNLLTFFLMLVLAETGGHTCSSMSSPRVIAVRRLLDRNRDNRKEYLTWYLVKRRCQDRPDAIFRKHVKNLAALTLCDRWQDFKTFLQDVGPAPPEHVLVRLDPTNRGYEPGNVVWATRAFAARHAGRTRRYLTFQGETLTVTEWANRLGVRPGLLFHRLDHHNWSVEKTLTQPLEKHKPPRSRYRRATAKEIVQLFMKHLETGVGFATAMDLVESELGLDKAWHEVLGLRLT